MEDKDRSREQLLNELLKLRQLVSELNKGEDRYRNLIENALVGVYRTNLKGDILYLNDTYLRMFGFETLEEAVSEGSLVRYRNPEDRKTVLELLKKTGKLSNFEVEFLTKTGEPLIVLLAATLESDVITGMIMDITTRRRAAGALEESESKYRLLAENVLDVIWTMDMDLNFTYISPSVAPLLGITADQAMHTSLREILTPRSYDIVLDVLQEETPKRKDTFGFRVLELEHIHQDGSTRWAEVKVSFLRDANGRPKGILGVTRDITHRKEAEAALKESEERYRIAIEASNDGVAIVQNNVHVYVNQAFLKMFRYKTLDEIVGKHKYCNVHPDDYERVINYAEVRQKGNYAPIRYEFKGIRKDKKPIDIEVSVNTITYKGKKAILAYLRDITARKQAEEEIIREREKLKTLSENAPFGMVLIDNGGRFTYINRKFTELFGYDLSDVPNGRTWCRKAYPDSEYRHRVVSAWVEDLGDAQFGEEKPNVFTVTCKDGTLKNIQFISAVLVTGDYLMTCEDITEKKQLENQLHQLQKMEAIGTLAAGIAHDFNNVLTGIIGFTEMVYEDLVPDSAEHRRLGLVLKGAHRGRDLVKQILTFSRQTEQDRKPLALTQIVEEGLKILRPLLPSTIQIMSRSLTDDDMTLSDPVQIHQVLMNLCTNAAHAMRDNGGVLDISVSKTCLSQNDSRPVPEMEPGEYIVLEVRDTGCGMTSETLERMFDPFFTTKEQGEGTGLGLSVVHGILKSHGGYVAVESKPGKGTVFHIYFPKVEKRAVTEDEEVQATIGNKERILIIDDEDILVELNKQRLSRLGYEVIATTSSVDALDIFRKEPDTFDLVITDQTMPHLTGMDLATELLQIRSTIPIILCTGHSETVLSEQARKAGIKAFLIKPAGKQQLAQTIRRVLDEKREE